MSRPALVVVVLLVGACFPGRARAQTYQVSVEETGTLPTVYTKRFNWRYYLTVYRHTTMVPLAGSPTLCSESPCLDDDLPGGGLPPDLTRGGTASATVPGMTSGAYRLELRYNQTVNRATSVPWKLTTDAATNKSRSGNLDQKNTAPGTGNWLVLGNTGQNPVSVDSTATFVFGSDTITFNGSLSYGGIRLVRVGPIPPPATDAGADGSAGDAGSDASSDAGSTDAASDAETGGAGGAAGGMAGSAGGPDEDAAAGGNAGSKAGVVPADEGGCGCAVPGAADPWSVGALTVLTALAGGIRRRRHNALS